MSLPSLVRPALAALGRRIAPPADDAAAAEFLARLEDRILSLEEPQRGELIGALRFFDSPVTGMLLSGRPRRFSSLPAAEQDALLREWEASAIGLRRTVFQALRRLILTTWYARPETHAEIGMLPPLHTREPAFPWEGPLAAATTSSTGTGPVARSWADAARPVEWPAGILRGDALSGDSRLTADVCVVGSGAGGSVVAAQLSAAGHDVIVLEEGGFFSGTDFDDDEGRLAPLLFAEGGARATDDLSVILLQGSCVGGGTTLNWMMTLRPMPWVMDEWERGHGADLLGAAQLTPALAAIESEIRARPLEAAAQNPSNRIILDGAARLGWRTLEARINADGCVRAGACSLGCRWGAKQTAADVYLPRALAAGTRVLTHVRAERIDRMESAGAAPLKRVTGSVLDAVTRVPIGRVQIDAPVVVLAAGAVGTPVLLDRSGLGGGGVGRWLRLHPTTAVFGRYDRVMYGMAGAPQSAVCSEFLHGDDGYGFWIECPALRPGLAAAALPGFGQAHRSRMLELTRLGALIVLVRDGADRTHSSGNVRVDRRGRVRIRYRLTAPDRRQLALALQAAARLHLAAGADEVVTLHARGSPIRSERDVARLTTANYAPNRIGLFSAHVNGTCRIGRDPRESGCTPDAERHGVPGLYVADGSLLPTAPGVNPQLTIMALARLVADRIAARHPR